MRISLGFKYLIFFFCATSVELYPFTIYFQYYVSASEKVLFEQSGLHHNYFYYSPNKRLIIRIQVNVIMPALNENWVLQFFCNAEHLRKRPFPSFRPSFRPSLVTVTSQNACGFSEYWILSFFAPAFVSFIFIELEVFLCYCQNCFVGFATILLLFFPCCAREP